MKKVLCITGIMAAFGLSYKIGEIIGGIKAGKEILDVVDERFPGVKRTIAEQAVNEILDAVFISEKHTSKN